MAHKTPVIEHNSGLSFQTKTTLKSYWLIIFPTIVNIISSNVAGVSLKTIGAQTLLNTIETTLEWAKTMIWKGISPLIKSFTQRVCG